MPTEPRLRDVTFASGDVVLAGSLAVPDQDVASAGVVMVGGSGPSDRNNDTFFPPIRQHLVDAGIAVLSYDKRGVGSSSGDWRDSTLDDLAADTTAASVGSIPPQPRPPYGSPRGTGRETTVRSSQKALDLTNGRWLLITARLCHPGCS
jgi:hypothetical protein